MLIILIESDLKLNYSLNLIQIAFLRLNYCIHYDLICEFMYNKGFTDLNKIYLIYKIYNDIKFIITILLITHNYYKNKLGLICINLLMYWAGKGVMLRTGFLQNNIFWIRHNMKMCKRNTYVRLLSAWNVCHNKFWQANKKWPAMP